MGTLVHGSGSWAKTSLAGGAFEDAVRAAGVERLVCVSSIVRDIALLGLAEDGHDPHDLVLDACAGTFRDRDWFRGATELRDSGRRRADAIDAGGDWWYVDDEARRHLAHARRIDLFRAHLGTRIFVPEPDGDGRDVLDWLRDAVGAPPG